MQVIDKMLPVLALFALVPALSGQVPTAREEVLAAMQQRPGDPWPRGLGHVPLALPGTEERAKSYHEPGGGISPAVRSFGLAIWITSTDGKILATSDSLPLADLTQKLVWHDGLLSPAISTHAKEYETEWSVGPENGVTRLALTAHPQPGHKLILAVRSVGPAGDAVRTLDWDGGRLRVNGRFSLHLTPSPASVSVGLEGPAGWTTAAAPQSRRCMDRNGWCYARIELPKPGDYRLAIEDAYPLPLPALKAASTRSALTLDLPDPRFAESMNAQVAHLMMGLVSNQTRPGEPTNYPLTWLRDGAFQVVSLARAGRLETARDLARYFAETDFFGGFGAEGDAAGLSLWAITEVAARAHDRDFDAYLWPHIVRKAEFLLGLMETRRNVERFSTGPIVPKEHLRPEIYRVAEPPRDGLIAGRMDHGIRPMYITAVSYLGLTRASAFAAQNAAPAESERWHQAAASLQEAWLRKFTADDDDERTFMSGLYPTWIAVSKRAEYETGLRRQWNSDWHGDQEGWGRQPWTYFSFAHAHNWLYMGQTDPAWKTLRWYWDHQPSPGLYTWWEGSGEENSFRQWDYVRGWVKPPHVTPHYWSAATHLLLQLDILAYVDESAAQPELVLGGGIPAEWCARPMKVRGLPTRLGELDWEWDGRAMTARLRGRTVPVRLGPAFPKSARLEVKFD